MEEKKSKLVIDGNAFYELDLECQKKKQQLKNQKKDIGMQKNHVKRQRN